MDECIGKKKYTTHCTYEQMRAGSEQDKDLRNGTQKSEATKCIAGDIVKRNNNKQYNIESRMAWRLVENTIVTKNINIL